MNSIHLLQISLFIYEVKHLVPVLFKLVIGEHKNIYGLLLRKEIGIIPLSNKKMGEKGFSYNDFFG